MRSLQDDMHQGLQQAATGRLPVRLPAKGGKEHGRLKDVQHGPTLKSRDKRDGNKDD